MIENDDYRIWMWNHDCFGDFTGSERSFSFEQDVYPRKVYIKCNLCGNKLEIGRNYIYHIEK